MSNIQMSLGKQQMMDSILKSLSFVEENRELEIRDLHEIFMPAPGIILNKYMIIYGKTASGKTTQIIRLLKFLLSKNPELRIGVYEHFPEIKNTIPSVISVDSFSNPEQTLKKLDLFICMCDYHQLFKTAYENSIPVWAEFTLVDVAEYENLKKHLPCLKDFSYIFMEKFECKQTDGFAICV